MDQRDLHLGAVARLADRGWVAGDGLVVRGQRLLVGQLLVATARCRASQAHEIAPLNREHLARQLFSCPSPRVRLIVNLCQMLKVQMCVHLRRGDTCVAH